MKGVGRCDERFVVQGARSDRQELVSVLAPYLDAIPTKDLHPHAKESDEMLCVLGVVAERVLQPRPRRIPDRSVPKKAEYRRLRIR